jgi:putative N6-adenine-specific DNA methylase
MRIYAKRRVDIADDIASSSFLFTTLRNGTSSHWATARPLDHDVPMSGTDRTRRRSRFDAFVVCLPGVEPLLEEELAGLGVRGRRRRGGIAAPMTTRQLYAANLHLRTATRIVVRVARFDARTFAALERELKTIDWSPWIAADTPVWVRPTSHGSRLWHTGAVAERVLGAVPGRPADLLDEPAADGTAADDDDDDERLRLIVRLVRDQVTVSVDASGEPLHRRGWRGPTAKAPLRPTLAAAMVRGAGWYGQGPLLDPFCGSGTIPIEAALLARRVPPGLGRSFAFQRWPCFEPGTWASVDGAARAAIRPAAGVPILASDRDPGAVAATVANARRAGVADDVDVRRAVVSDVDAPPPGSGTGWLVTNPPYGRRVRGGRDRRDLYARIGQVVTARLPGWTVGLLVEDATVARHSGLPLVQAWPATNGGIPVRFLVAVGASSPTAPTEIAH